jgi:dephospho-CoA kinase
VVVRSDILLHLPGHEPILFSATTDGVIVDHLTPVPPNELYPWLGRPDLSSWFVPAGAAKVLAAMQLEESVRHDFRARALQQLAARLGEYRAAADLPPPSVRRRPASAEIAPHQLTLFDDERRSLVLIVVGAIASGKTTIGNHLELHRGFHHIEGSRMLHKAAAQLGLAVKGSNFDLADELFTRFGFDVVEREVAVPLLQNLDGPVVYTGCRTVEGIATMRDAALKLGRTVLVVLVSTPANLRLSRAVDRARTTGRLDAARFEDISARDEAYGAVQIGKNICDAHITNGGELSSLLAKVDSLIALPGSEYNTARSSRIRTAEVVSTQHSRPEAAATLRRLSPEPALDPDQSGTSGREIAVARILDLDPAAIFGADDDD